MSLKIAASSPSSRCGRTSKSALRAARRPGRWTIEAVGELFPVLRERRDQPGGFLSGGEQQMLTIARTLTGNPELLLLDEPSEGLAPLVVDTLRDKIAELKVQGLTILLAEQRVDFALALADRVYVLEKGAVRYSGPAAELREDKGLVDRLLSLSRRSRLRPRKRRRPLFRRGRRIARRQGARRPATVAVTSAAPPKRLNPYSPGARRAGLPAAEDAELPGLLRATPACRPGGPAARRRRCPYR